MKGIAFVAVVALAVTGCITPTTSPGGFDGGAALAFVEDIVYEDDGSLRPRDPGADGHEATAQWLLDQMEVPGWDRQLDGFTGTEYMELDKGAVAGYYEQSRYCGQEDRDQLPDLDFRNLYATLPAVGPADGHVVLAAHWDAKEDAHGGDGPVPAANDGASGVGLLLQLQRHVAEEGLEFPFDLTIAFFDGEDGFEDCHPLAGSLWAARQGSLGNVSQLILLDMVGDADARFIREAQSVDSDPDLVDAIWTHTEDGRLDANFIPLERPILDDHVPFIEEGIAAIDIIDAGRPGTFPPYWHTTEDTPDKLSADMLGAMGDLVVWILTDPGTQALLQD